MTRGTSLRTTREQFEDYTDEGAMFTTSGTTVLWNPEAPGAVLDLTANFTIIPNTDKLVAGKKYFIHIRQDSSGSRKLTWGAAFRWHQDAEPELNTEANADEVFEFYCNGSLLFGRKFYTSLSE